jgi:GTPase SAR1 family protein
VWSILIAVLSCACRYGTQLVKSGSGVLANSTTEVRLLREASRTTGGTAADNSIIGANAALLCYDITNAPSFTEMGHWLVELRSTLPEDTILHIVGTKADIVAEDPATREIPFERCIAYVAENLYPASAQHSSHFQPSTAPAGDYFSSAAAEGKITHHRNKSTSNILGSKPNKSSSNLFTREEPLASPHSNRSSMGFWGQDLGWDCCHEVSASTGEGVEEVFRVITRRLVEQRNSRAALEARLMQEYGGMTPGLDERGSFYGEYGSGDQFGGTSGNGSFRVGHGDKRRSWLGLPSFPSISGDEQHDGDTESVRRRRKGCC